MSSHPKSVQAADVFLKMMRVLQPPHPGSPHWQYRSQAGPFLLGGNGPPRSKPEAARPGPLRCRLCSCVAVPDLIIGFQQGGEGGQGGNGVFDGPLGRLG